MEVCKQLPVRETLTSVLSYGVTTDPIGRLCETTLSVHENVQYHEPDSDYADEPERAGEAKLLVLGTLALALPCHCLNDTNMPTVSCTQRVDTSIRERQLA